MYVLVCALITNAFNICIRFGLRGGDEAGKIYTFMYTMTYVASSVERFSKRVSKTNT